MSNSELTLIVWIFNWIVAVMDMDFELHLSYQDWVDFCKSRLPLASTPSKWKVVETLTYVHYSASCATAIKGNAMTASAADILANLVIKYDEVRHLYHSVYFIGGWGWSIPWGFNSLQDLHLALIHYCSKLLCLFYFLWKAPPRVTKLITGWNEATCRHVLISNSSDVEAWFDLTRRTRALSCCLLYISWNSH